MLIFADFLHLCARLGAEKVHIDTGPWTVRIRVAPCAGWPRQVELEDYGGSDSVLELRRIFAGWSLEGARKVLYREKVGAIELEVKTRLGWNWWKADQRSLGRFVLAPLDLYYNAMPVRRVFPLSSRYHEIMWLAEPGQVGLRVRHRRGFRGRKEGGGYRLEFRHGGRKSRDCWRYYLDPSGRLSEPESLFECCCRGYFQVALDPLQRVSQVHLYRDGGWQNTLRAELPHPVQAFYSLEGEPFAAEQAAAEWWKFFGPLVDEPGS